MKRQLLTPLGLGIVAMLAFIGASSPGVQAQAEPCRFVMGFAALRDQVSAEKVGRCLEDERTNAEDGNVEQRTSGGLMVWRKIDNFTAFTDGGTSWVAGPNGVQSRPNGERFSWELEPASSARSAPASPAPSAQASPAPMSAGAGAAAPADSGPPASVAVAQTDLTAAGPAASIATATPTSVATATPTSVPTNTPTPTKATTPTPTPNPVQVKFTKRPDDVDTGNDAEFEVATNLKKGTCALLITYRNTPQVGLGAVDVEDGRCEWKFTLAENTKRGRARAEVSVTGKEGTAKVEDTFQVKKGDTVYSGDVDLDIDPDELPDRVDVGEEFEVSIDTNIEKRGTCSVSVAWPKVANTGGENKTPDDKGRCSWKLVAPTTITKSGTATLTVVVQKNKSSVRVLTKEFDVRK